MNHENSMHEEPMDELERSLAGELRRVEPAPDFADEVMARIAGEKGRHASKSAAKVLSMPVRRVGAKLALAAALLILIFPAGYRIREVHEKRQAAATEARFDLAMRLTTRTLAHVDQEIDGTLQRTAKQSAEEPSR